MQLYIFYWLSEVAVDVSLALINQGQWARFTIPDMNSLLLGGPGVQSDGWWLALGYECHYCNFQDILPFWPFLQFIGIIDRFYYLLLFSFGSLNNAFQYYESQPPREGFQVSSKPIPPNPVSNVCVSLAIGSLPSISGRLQRAIGIAFKFFGCVCVSLTPLTNNSRESFPCLELEFLLESLQLLGEHCHLKWHNFN